MEEKRGDFENGPIAQRKITDCLCCLIFLVAIVGFVAASAYGWMNGDPSRLLIGWDSDSNGCGFSEATLDYPYLYWPSNPAAELAEAVEELNIDKALALLNGGVCVKECPSSVKTSVVDCHPTGEMLDDINFPTSIDVDGGVPGKASCIQRVSAADLETFGIDIGTYIGDSDMSQAAIDAWSGPFRYDTKKMYGFCVPEWSASGGASALSDSTIKTFKKLFQDTVLDDKLTSYLADIANSWQVIVVSSVTAILLGYIYLLLIRYLGALIIYFSIVLLQLALIGGGVYMYFESDTYEEESDYRDWLKYAAYGIWGVAGLFLCCVCCCWRSI